MKYIIHDIRVWRWGCSTAYPDISKSRIDIQYPLSVRRRLPCSGSVWVVTIARPAIALLNSYEMECAYHAAHPAQNPLKICK